MKSRSITLQALIREVGRPAVIAATGCDSTLPGKWEKGTMPGRASREKLIQLAKDHGYPVLQFFDGAR